MSSRVALTLALLVLIALVAFGAVLLNVPVLAATIGGLIASGTVIWRGGRVRKRAKSDQSLPT